jgi:hypothetical protein
MRRNRPLHDFDRLQRRHSSGKRIHLAPLDVGEHLSKQRHVGASQPVVDQPAGGAARTGSQRVSAFKCHQPPAAIAFCSHRVTILPLPKRLNGAILASSGRESGERPLHRTLGSHT